MSFVRDQFAKGALGIGSRLAAWIAVAYLGYWAAVFLQSVLVPAVIYPALGSPVEEWRLTAFRAVLFSGSPDTLPFSGIRSWLMPARSPVREPNRVNSALHRYC